MERDEREAKLPAWLRELLAGLRKRIEQEAGALRRELDRVMKQDKLLKARNEAMMELLECAARGGHKTAKEILDVVASYCDDEYVTLDSVLGRGRHEEDSGCDLSDDKCSLDHLREKGGNV